MKHLEPCYRHVPHMIPVLHKNAYRAFHSCIDQLTRVISAHNLAGCIEITLLHKHGDIQQEQRYVEYFQQNHLLQVALSNEQIDSAQMRLQPYSFYFRNGHVYKYEFTTYDIRKLDLPEINSEFFTEYDDILQRHDLDDFFGFRYAYKSRLLETSQIVERNLNDVSLTSVLSEDYDLDFDQMVQTAWPVSEGSASCHHCLSHCGTHICVHPICHPTGCVDPGPWDRAELSRLYSKIRREIYLDPLESLFGDDSREARNFDVGSKSSIAKTKTEETT